MKKFLEIIFTIALVFLSTPLFAQNDWQIIQLDDNFSFKFPSDYRRMDTLGQNNFLASTRIGHLQATKVPQPNADIKDENDLVMYYSAFQKSVIDQSDGNLVFDSTMQIGKLNVRKFAFESVWNDTAEIQEYVIAFIDGSIYSFGYASPKHKRFTAAKEMDIFFRGITITNTDFGDQLTIPNNSYVLGQKLGYVLGPVILVGLILTIILWLLKKYKQVRVIKGIFCWGFLSWGIFWLLIYIGNIFYSKNLYPLLIMGILGVAIGYGLKRPKVPEMRAT